MDTAGKALPCVVMSAIFSPVPLQYTVDCTVEAHKKMM